MMDFCDSCGILLSAPSKDLVPYCNPCKEQAEQSKLHPDKKHCNCELCYNEVSISVSDMPPLSQRNHKQKTKQKEKHMSPYVQNRTANNVHKNDDVKDSWSGVIDPQSPVRSQVLKENLDSSSDSPSRQTQADDLKENQVAEEIRDQWEREQAEMKRQLVKRDTPEITAIVSGTRRKLDGSRFYVGGVDISFYKESKVDAVACLTVLQMPDLQMVYQRMEKIELTQPYIPGFLAFREVPALLKLYEKLQVEAPPYLPDVIMVDGNGILHPRGFGFACQLGVILDVPTMGVAKTLITAQGIVDDEVHKQTKHTLSQAGDGFDLVSDSGEVLGMCIRNHDKAPNPIYISVGHKMTLDSAKWLALECSKYRIPEPVRRADLDSREYIRKGSTDPYTFILT